MSSTDPFSIVHDALWFMIERNPDIQSLVKDKNQIKFDKQSSKKDQINDADLPELVLLAGGANPGKYDNSSNTSITKGYIWAITTGDFRITEVYNKVAWELFRSMVDWSIVLCALTWNGDRFVNNFRLISADEGDMMESQNRGIRGWSAVWTCEVDMSFCTNNLRITGS